MKELYTYNRNESIGRGHRTPSTIIRPEDRQAWLNSRSRDNIPPVPHFAANTHRRNTGKLPYASTTEDYKDTDKTSYESNHADTSKGTAADAADKKDSKQTTVDPTTPPVNPGKKWPKVGGKLTPPAKGTIKTVFRRVTRFSIPPIITALLILIAAEIIPGFKEEYQLIYGYAVFFVELCESILKLGVHSLNLLIHFVSQLFGNGDPTALDSFLQSFADIGEVFQNFWNFIRAL